jgi:LacI family transcriptional regulator
VFCGNDVIAIGAFNAARAHGVRIPEDLTLIGFDDIPMAAWEAFGLSTVHYDLGELAQEAARLLVRRIESDDDPEPRRTLFTPELVLRATHASR